MRVGTLAIPPPKTVTLLVVSVVAFATGAGILWGSDVLELKWMVACLTGLFICWIAVLTRDIESFFLLSFVFLLPLRADFHIGYEKIASGAAGFIFSACDAALAPLYGVWLWRLLTAPPEERRVRIIPSVSLPYGMFFLWCALSMVRAVDPRLTVYELFRLLKTYLAFLYLVNNVREERQLKGISLALCAGILLEGFVAFGQFFSGEGFNLRVLGETRHSFLVQEMGSGELARVSGTLGHPNGLAFFLMTMLPIVTSVIVAAKSRWLTLCGFLTFMAGLVALILTFSRSGWVSILLVTPFIVFLGTWKRSGFLKAIKRIFIFALIGLICASPFAPKIAQRLLEDDHGRAYSRVPLMQVAWNVIQSNPIFGVGLNNYNLVSRNYDNTLERITLHIPNPVHNTFLLVAAEVGIPALFFLFWLFLALFRRGWESFLKGEGLHQFLCLGILGSLIGYLVHGLTSFNLLAATYYFAFFMGLVNASIIPNERAETNR